MQQRTPHDGRPVPELLLAWQAHPTPLLQVQTSATANSSAAAEPERRARALLLSFWGAGTVSTQNRQTSACAARPQEGHAKLREAHGCPPRSSSSACVRLAAVFVSGMPAWVTLVGGSQWLVLVGGLRWLVGSCVERMCGHTVARGRAPHGHAPSPPVSAYTPLD